MKGFYKRGRFAIKIVITCITALIYFEKPLSAQQVFALNNASAEDKVVHLLEEPRHRTVHREGDLYLPVSYTHLTLPTTPYV